MKLDDKAVRAIVEHLAGPGYYGSLKIRIIQGVITSVRRDQVLKVQKALTNTQYSGTLNLEIKDGRIVHASKEDELAVE